MKNALFTILCLLITTIAFGQNSTISNYQFHQTEQTYNSISTSTSAMEVTYPVWGAEVVEVPIGFTFNFDLNDYTNCYVSTEGYITFGTTAPAISATNPISGTETYQGVVAGYAANLTNGTSESPIYADVQGVAPNRIFIVEFKDAARSNIVFNRGAVMNFQIRLHESNNKIEVVYGAANLANENAAVTGQIGLRGASNFYFSNRRDLAKGVAETAYGVLATNEVETSNALSPISGTTFSWSPCATCVTKYWVGGGSPLTGRTADRNFNTSSNWSITYPLAFGYTYNSSGTRR